MKNYISVHTDTLRVKMSTNNIKQGADSQQKTVRALFCVSAFLVSVTV